MITIDVIGFLQACQDGMFLGMAVAIGLGVVWLMVQGVKDEIREWTQDRTGER